MLMCYVFFVKQKTAYEMRISDWSSDVCASDLAVLPTGVDPSLFNLSETSGVCITSWTTELSFSTIPGGVPAGTSRPFHAVIWTFGKPASAMVGTSGRLSTRSDVVTARAFRLPDWMCSRVEIGRAHV